MNYDTANRKTVQIVSPSILVTDYYNGTDAMKTLTGFDTETYQLTLKSFAEDNPRNYSDFRRFMHALSPLYNDMIMKVNDLSDEDIDYALDQLMYMSSKLNDDDTVIMFIM